MPRQFLVIIVCFSLSPLISVAQNRKCSIDPAPTPSFLGYPYTLTCYAKARTIILAWKSGVQNQSVTSNSDTLPSNTFNISSLGVSSTPESVRQLQTDGYDTSYQSLRKSTMTISKVSMESARPYYCFVFDLAASAMLFCQWSLVINPIESKKCSISPVKGASIVSDTYTFTCSSKAISMILSWKLGVQNIGQPVTISNPYALPAYSANISTLGVSSTPESLAQLQTDGFVATYKSLRLSTITISKVAAESAKPFYCFILDIATSAVLFCQSNLIVLANQPFFDSVGVDPGRGLITNLECAVKFLGVATLRVKITNIQQEILNETAHLFTVVDWHGINVSHSHRVKVIKEGDNYRVAPDIGVQSAFHCDITLDGNIFTYSVRREFDAPVTFATIAPRNASRCSERRCFMHEKLVCTCDGRPKPKAFMWRVSVNYENFRHMVYRWPEQNTAYSGRNTLECRVFNVVGNITFTAVGRFITHVLAFEWLLDTRATYIIGISGMSKLKAWCPVTTAAVSATIAWVFMPCHRRCCSVD